MQISTILDQIDLGAIALPKFQRGFVWNRDQVRALMDSLYRKHPIGSFLVWITKAEEANARGDAVLQAGTVDLLLDGQQRITTLYGLVRGKPPKFFDGNPKVISGLYFNIETEIFEFYALQKMRDNSLWIDVTRLMQRGVADYIMQVAENPDLKPHLRLYTERLNAIDQIKSIELHIDQVTGEDKDVDTVVDIFNRVNSGGTKLSKGDLALAKVCASWPEGREEMKAVLGKWGNVGFYFQLDWLLRCTNTLLTGKALFSALKDIDTPTFQEGLKRAQKSIDWLLNMIASRLGLDHNRVLGSRYSFPLLTRYLMQQGGHIDNHTERDKLLYWYIHTFLWGRYASAVESTLTKDLTAIQEGASALDRLLEGLRQDRGDLRLHPDDFRGWSQAARFYPLLYMLTRVCKSQDWGTGVELSNSLLGFMSSLELHHIFPKSLLYEHGYPRSQVNAIANFTFLTKETNLLVSNRDPAEYLEEFQLKNPGAIDSHWIPMDKELWKLENYPSFLAARRELLAQAANNFLDSLIQGTIPEMESSLSILDRKMAVVPGNVESEEEEREIKECNEWAVNQGLPEGEYTYELCNPDTGEPLAIIDLAWPEGLQPGYSPPAALLLNEPAEVEGIVNRAGYKYFKDVESFKNYVNREILATLEVSYG